VPPLFFFVEAVQFFVNGFADLSIFTFCRFLMDPRLSPSLASGRIQFISRFFFFLLLSVDYFHSESPWLCFSVFFLQPKGRDHLIVPDTFFAIGRGPKLTSLRSFSPVTFFFSR